MSVKINSNGCTADLEYITIKCRLYYLPREFSSVTLTSLYHHPKADIGVALNIIAYVISEYENRDPDTLSIIAGDFNQANLKTVLPSFKQHVTCPTRGQRTIDHCYCKVKSAYKAIERSGLGTSDYSVVLLILPRGADSVWQRTPVERNVTLWPQSDVEELRDCFECTDWSVFGTHCDLDEYIITVTVTYAFVKTSTCRPEK
ncbi:hypothetical protein HOLleu_43013 [Holothuria leucospilota]|uniref:Endonuclease/exonuclease/phosphatase domain-containing protein n=1 Tax=Holothuria leucospilota TaxID=206669 RepID=A0A9Q0YA05_HOLLE|nr:hypothetical protein HOLleu_43013 [Holothuria leucospilota]